MDFWIKIIRQIWVLSLIWIPGNLKFELIQGLIMMFMVSIKGFNFGDVTAPPPPKEISSWDLGVRGTQGEDQIWSRLIRKKNVKTTGAEESLGPRVA
jgi:hypothetical protein